MPRIIQHFYIFCSSRTRNPKLLAAKLEDTGTNPRPRLRPLDALHFVKKVEKGKDLGSVPPPRAIP